MKGWRKVRREAIYFILFPVMLTRYNLYTCVVNAKKDKLTNTGRFYIPIQDVWSIGKKKVGGKEGGAYRTRCFNV